MKNDERKVLLTCALFVIVISMSAQLSQHGLVLNGGIGRVKHQYRTDYVSRQSGYQYEEYEDGNYFWKEYNYKSGFSAGYRLRFKIPVLKSFHYDLDMNVGANVLKSTNFIFTYTPNEEGGAIYNKVGYSSSAPYYFTSIGGTVNYAIIRNISMGLGIEPTLYLSRAMKNNVDIPVVAKVAYDFSVI